MARKKTKKRKRRTNPKVIVVRRSSSSGNPKRRRRRKRKVARKKRKSPRKRTKRTAVARGAAIATKMAWDEKHTLAAVGAGLVLGALKAKNIKLPHISQIGVAGTYGIAAWIAGKYMKSPLIQHTATGLLTIAAYEAGQQFLSGEVSGLNIEGEESPYAWPYAEPDPSPLLGYGTSDFPYSPNAGPIGYEDEESDYYEYEGAV